MYIFDTNFVSFCSPVSNVIPPGFVLYAYFKFILYFLTKDKYAPTSRTCSKITEARNISS